MFKRRKYILQFKTTLFYTTQEDIKAESINEFLIRALHMLQDKYSFEIISLNIRFHTHNSYITIKCNKKDKLKIFTDYCILAGNNISEFSF